MDRIADLFNFAHGCRNFVVGSLAASLKALKSALTGAVAAAKWL